MNFFSYFLLVAIFFSGLIQPVFGQCTGCTVNINGNNNPSSTIVSGSVVCITGDRTSTINFNNSSNISICISPQASWNGSASSLTSLSVINNYGNLTVSNSFNSTSLRINNHNILNFNINLASGTTINNFNIMRSSGDIQINGTLNLAGTLDVVGELHLNSNGRISALNANQCNSVTVNGTFRSDGIITGSDLDYAGTGSGLLVNKMPEGNAVTKLSGGARVGNCTMVNCVETVSPKEAAERIWCISTDAQVLFPLLPW